VAGVVFLAMLPGCAVVESQYAVTADSNGKLVAVPNGIPYFLPRRPFVVTVSEPANGGIPSITVTPGAAEPDLSRRYVLSQGINLVADNEFNVGVSAKGLLTSSTSTATSQVVTTVQNVASTIGMLGLGIPGPNLALMDAQVAAFMKSNITTGQAPAQSGTTLACPAAGTSYQIVIYPEASPITSPVTLCNGTNGDGGPYKVTWHRADLAVGASAPFGKYNESATSDTPVSGLFFRHELPYLVSIVGPAGNHTRSDTVITSPDESETDFFPVKRSFFANNTANITVTDGVITAVDQTTKSEVAAATGLPATFISSYMAAIGQLLSGLSTNSADEQKLIQQMLATNATQNQSAAVAQVQNRLCAKTIGSYNLSTLSPADLATALAAIKAACPGP
jgi:hypothetical protein